MRSKLYRFETTFIVALVLLTSIFAFQNCSEKGLDNKSSNSGSSTPEPQPQPPGPTAPTVQKKQVWNAPGTLTFVVPANAQMFKLTMVGGGGGGGPGVWSGGYISNCRAGGLGSAYTGTGGGSGSAFINKNISVQPGQVLQITVGGGGMAACDGGRDGGASVVVVGSTTYRAGGGGGGAHCFGCASPVGTAGTGGDVLGANGGGGAANCSVPAQGGVSPLGTLGGAGGASICGGRGTNGSAGYVSLEWWE